MDNSLSGRRGPARQTSEKDVLCPTGQAGPVLCTRQMACRTSFLSRQRDVIASFSFGACTWCMDFLSELYFQVLYLNSYNFHFFICSLDSRRLIAHYVFS